VEKVPDATVGNGSSSAAAATMPTEANPADAMLNDDLMEQVL